MLTTRFLKTGLALSLSVGALSLSGAALAANAVMYTPNNVQTIDTALEIARKTASDLSIQQVTSGAGALMKRIEAEAQNPLGDVVWGTGYGTMAASSRTLKPTNRPRTRPFLKPSTARTACGPAPTPTSWSSWPTSAN